MSPNSGHLVTTLSKMTPGDSYELLPGELQGAARRALRGGDEAHVSLNSGGRLSRWAAGRRKEARRRMAKESRRRNR
jgi:hypothetical protein